MAVEPSFRAGLHRRGAGLRRQRRAARAFERKLYVIRKRIENAVDDSRSMPRAKKSFYIVQPVVQHADLQGHARRPTSSSRCFPDLHGPGFRVGARARAPALQHQHVPVVAAGAPVPLRRAQRRDQHAHRQHQLDARARRAAPVEHASATTCSKILPVIREGGSDTATFDNVLEFLVMTGRSLPHAILMMIPEPWQNHETMPAGAARRSTSTTRR